MDWQDAHVHVDAPQEDTQAADLDLSNGAAGFHSAVGLRAVTWDYMGHKSQAWSIKEQIDNCLSKAEPDYPCDATPWNAEYIRLRLEEWAEGDYLIITDNGRGCTWKELEEGFAGMGHTRVFLPQDMSSKAISVFGTGSKTGDASLATDVLYFTKHSKSMNYTLIGRAGKDLSDDMKQEHLHFSRIQVNTDWIQQLAAQTAAQAQGLAFDGPIKTEDDPMIQQIGQVLHYRQNTFELIKRASVHQSKTTGFARMLRLRPNKIHCDDGGVGLRYIHQDGKKKISINDMLSRNFLFPPSRIHNDYGHVDETPEALALLEEQQRIVIGLNPDNYYVHPESGAHYSPEIDVHKEPVDWGQNPLLKHLGNFHSDIITIPADPERYGSMNDEPAARMVITYLTDNTPERSTRTIEGRTQENERYCGVAVYMGCRRICDAEEVDNNWSLGGVADEYMKFAQSVTDWAVTHSTHANVGIGYKEYLGEEVLNLYKKYSSIYKNTNSHFLAFHGVHMAIVVTPGLLTTNDDKQEFAGTLEARNLMLDCLRTGMKWMLENPPVPLQPLLKQFKEREARQAAMEVARLAEIQEKKRQQALAAAQPAKPVDKAAYRNQLASLLGVSDDDDDDLRDGPARKKTRQDMPKAAPATGTTPNKAMNGKATQLNGKSPKPGILSLAIGSAAAQNKESKITTNGASAGPASTNSSPAEKAAKRRVQIKTLLTKLKQRVKKNPGKAEQILEEVLSKMAGDGAKATVTFNDAPSWL